MYLLDANILIYAFRRDSPHHDACYRWLTDRLAQGEAVVAPDVVELALLRITTLPSLGEAAAAVDDVFAFLRALRRTSYRRLEPGEVHGAHLERLCRQFGLRGNDVNDAYLAALALERGATLVSADAGFGRFPALRWLNPLAPGDS